MDRDELVVDIGVVVVSRLRPVGAAEAVLGRNRERRFGIPAKIIPEKNRIRAGGSELSAPLPAI